MVREKQESFENHALKLEQEKEREDQIAEARAIAREALAAVAEIQVRIRDLQQALAAWAEGDDVALGRALIKIQEHLGE